MDLRDQKPSDRVVILQDKRKYTQAEKSNTRLHMTVVESNESLGLFFCPTLVTQTSSTAYVLRI
jgi:hypothetical protein